MFDVTIGSYDGAEICELVGLFLLSNVEEKFKNLNFGLYRDDGLGFTRKMSGSDIDRLRKDIIALFQTHGLKVDITCNLIQVDFLDVTFNLQTGKFSPYRKPNDTPLYINSQSNHPPTILKQLPKMISDRISSISCDENEFNKAKDEYNNSLKRSGFKQCINYKQPENTSPTPRQGPTVQPKRKRSIIWFNPPYNERVKSNVGRTFLMLLKKHFPPEHRYHQIFNKNNVKLSYSCTPNMAQAISGHNQVAVQIQDTT